MSIDTARLTILRQTLDAIGVTLPKPVAAALAERDKLAHAELTTTPTAPAIADTVAACILEDRDPLDDEQVRRMAVAAIIGAADGRLGHILREAGERRVRNALAANVNTVLAALCKAAGRAGEQLSTAHSVIGDADLDDAESVTRMAPDAAKAWVQAREAQELMRKVGAAWVQLAELTGFASIATDPTSRLTDVDLETFEKLGRKADAWSIVQAGAKVDLADATAIRERVARLQEARQQRQAGAGNAFRAEYRRTHGIGAA